jgi:hypothetical protein
MSDDELTQLLRERDLEARVLAQYRERGAGPAVSAGLRRSVAARHGMSERLLVQPLLMYPGVPWSEPLVRELKLLGTFSSAVERASRIVQHNAAVFDRHPRLAGAQVRRGILTDFFADRWGVRPDRLESAIRARGFADYRDFAGAARQVFVYERTSTGAYRADLLMDCFHVGSEHRSARSDADLS